MPDHFDFTERPKPRVPYTASRKVSRTIRTTRPSMVRTGLYTPPKAVPYPIPPPKPPGTLRQIASGLWETAQGKGPLGFMVGGTGKAMAGRGMQLRAIGRQQLARVPGPAKVVGVAGAGAGAAAAIEVISGRSPARIAHDVGRGLFSGGMGQGTQPRRQQVARRGGLSVGEVLPPSHQVVRTWQTFPGGPVFARLADGHIAVQKKDGTIKHFRPYRPVVIPRKWNARSMQRVATALKRQRKVATKILQITGGVPKRKVRVGGKAHRSVDV